MNIDEKIDQWKQLKKSKKLLEGRLSELREEILPYVIKEERAGVVAQKRNRTSYNEEEVWALFQTKDVHVDRYTKEVIDEDALEQLYLEGVLTDADLRRIREPKYTYALVEVGEDVQE